MIAGRRAWLWLGVALLLVLLFARACVRFLPADAPERPKAAIARPSTLQIPVAGVTARMLRDSFSEARATGRTHDAIDIPVPRGTQVLAVAAGRVEKLFESMQGGTTIYIRSTDGGWIDYYAHLDHYAHGLHEGQFIARGTLLASVGSTGDASSAAPHLHLAMNRARPGEHWYQGIPVNPYPLLIAGRR